MKHHQMMMKKIIKIIKNIKYNVSFYIISIILCSTHLAPPLCPSREQANFSLDFSLSLQIFLFTLVLCGAQIQILYPGYYLYSSSSTRRSWIIHCLDRHCCFSWAQIISCRSRQRVCSYTKISDSKKLTAAFGPKYHLSQLCTLKTSDFEWFWKPPNFFFFYFFQKFFVLSTSEKKLLPPLHPKISTLTPKNFRFQKINGCFWPKISSLAALHTEN